MASLSEILRRFRFHGVPGAPAVVGVPADRTEQIEAELLPVFAALADAQRANDELVAQAQVESQRRRTVARQEALSIMEAARRNAATTRSDAAAARLREAQAECTETLDRARSESQRIVSAAEERMPALVEEIVGRVFALAVRPRETGLRDEEAGP